MAGTRTSAACPEAPDQSRSGNPTSRRARGTPRGLDQGGDHMSEVVTTVTAQAAPDDPASPQTPTVTHYEQVAAKLSSAIDEALALMPDFTQSHPLTKGFVATQGSVSDAFILTTIAAVE